MLTLSSEPVTRIKKYYSSLFESLKHPLQERDPTTVGEIAILQLIQWISEARGGRDPIEHTAVSGT